MHILAAIMLRQHRLCIPIKENQTEITNFHCELAPFVILISDHQFYIVLISFFFFFSLMWKTSLQSGVLERVGRV